MKAPFIEFKNVGYHVCIKRFLIKQFKNKLLLSKYDFLIMINLKGCNHYQIIILVLKLIITKHILLNYDFCMINKFNVCNHIIYYTGTESTNK